MTFIDKDGNEHYRRISSDMAVEDNIKWSIEKPTQYSWRLRIRTLALGDEGNYTCFVRLTTNNNRAEANRTVFVTGKEFGFPECPLHTWDISLF